ncbi:MAG: 16S rRNA (cytosine(1402)-N(4))-methyltransferase RsmH [Clostridia bacterium]|nr:16S rRNA (cytosine(1402)-N(4))-methyltransferase RsmH [Clostridia bacterium]
MEFKHISVLLERSVDLLEVKADGVYVDGTLGGGGHSSLICSRLSERGCLIGIDRDDAALSASEERLKAYKCEKHLCRDNFFNIKEVLRGLGIGSVDGAILDLGVSSPQLDNAERGFSYNSDARLDMRMDRRAALDAYTVVNTYDERRLSDIIFRYGEERFAKRIARAICRERETGEIETTTQLSEVIKSAFPPSARFADKHPAKRTFQAIRIEVNGELDGLDAAIRDFAEVLKPGGRLAIITFHSLEDRIVKRAFADLAKGCTCPKDFPVCVCGKTPTVKLVNGKPITADRLETEANFRAHSAKLRVVEKL